MLPEISHSVADGMLTVKADACDPESKIVHMEFREKCKEIFLYLFGKNCGIVAKEFKEVRYEYHC